MIILPGKKWKFENSFFAMISLCIQLTKKMTLSPFMLFSQLEKTFLKTFSNNTSIMWDSFQSPVFIAHPPSQPCLSVPPQLYKL